MTRIKIVEIFASVFIIGGVVALIYLWTASPFGTSDRVGLTMAISTVELVIVTGIYAWHTRKMAEEMREQRYDAVRPIIDIRRDADEERRMSEEVAESMGAVSYGLSCVLHNIGLGPAIDVRSLIRIGLGEPEPHQFGALAKAEKTDRMILSLEHKDKGQALVAYYKDVYGRSFESSREVKAVDKQGWEIGPLKIRPVEEDELP